MKVFLLNELVPKEVKESVKEVCSVDINEMRLYDSYSVLSINCIPKTISYEIMNEYKQYLLDDNIWQYNYIL